MARASGTERHGAYSVEAREVIAEAPELRVVRITLGPGEEVPWHYHSAIADTFFCLDGILRVETRAPRRSHRLAPGESCEVPPKTAHRVTGGDGGRASFLVVQGIGVYDFVAVGGGR